MVIIKNSRFIASLSPAFPFARSRLLETALNRLQENLASVMIRLMFAEVTSLSLCDFDLRQENGRVIVEFEDDRDAVEVRLRFADEWEFCE